MIAVFLFLDAAISVSQASKESIDHGSSWGMRGSFDITSEFGVHIGMGPVFTKYAFRAEPFLYSTSLVGTIAVPSGRYELSGDFFMPSIANRWAFEFKSGVSTCRVIEFYGFGSDTPRDLPKEDQGYYRVDAWMYSTRCFLAYGISPSSWLGPLLALDYVEMYDKPDRLINQIGAGDLGAQRTHIGTGLELYVDTREASLYPRSGIYIEAEALNWVVTGTGREPYQKVGCDVRWFSTPSPASDIVLAVRLAGTSTLNSAPFFQSATLGGRKSLRGYEFERFRGSNAVCMSAELRFLLFRKTISFPFEFGGFILGDAGRLWYEGVSPGGLRSDAGFGFWGATFSRDILGVLYVAFAGEKPVVRAGFGFDY